MITKINARETIAVFAEAMEQKLARDDGTKPAWETESVENLFTGLFGEYIELDHAIRNFQFDPENYGDGKEILLECCDVALYAMMIFSQIHPLTRHNRRGTPERKIPKKTGE